MYLFRCTEWYPFPGISSVSCLQVIILFQSVLFLRPPAPAPTRTRIVAASLDWPAGCPCPHSPMHHVFTELEAGRVRWIVAGTCPSLRRSKRQRQRRRRRRRRQRRQRSAHFSSRRGVAAIRRRKARNVFVHQRQASAKSVPATSNRWKTCWRRPLSTTRTTLRWRRRRGSLKRRCRLIVERPLLTPPLSMEWRGEQARLFH